MFPHLLGKRGPGRYVAPGAGGGGEADPGLEEQPIVTVTAAGDATVNGKVKPGSFGKFVLPLATITAGRQYTFRYTPGFSRLAQQGKLAMVGFGLKNGNDFHIVGLRGDGSTGLDKYKVYGTPPNGWNKQTGHTESDGNAPNNGTQAGPNWIRLVVSADGTTYTFQTSSNGSAWSDEYTGAAPTPFSNVSGATTFGLALWFNNADAGPFTISIDQFADAAAPTATAPSFWNDTYGAYGDRTSSITVTTTATLGGGTINNLVDGAFTDNNSDSCFFGAETLREIKFDFGTAKCITGFRWIQGQVGTHGTWVFEGSNDDSSYTTLNTATLGHASIATVVYLFANTTNYRYYKLRQTSGTTNSSPWLREIEFKIGDAAGSARDALESGDRQSLIVESTTATLGGGSVANFIDGNLTTEVLYFNNAQSTREIKFDLGSGKIVTGFHWLQGTTASHGTWLIEGSNDDSSYTTLDSGFTLGAVNPTRRTFSNSTAYRYIKLRQTAGTTSSGPYLLEIDIKIG